MHSGILKPRGVKKVLTEWRVTFDDWLEDPTFIKDIEYWLRDNIDGQYGTDFVIGIRSIKFLREADARLCYLRFR